MAKNEATPENAERERDPFLDAIGLTIKRTRQALGLTAADMAARTGLGRAWFYLAEDGQQNFRIDSLRRIAAALNLEVRDLLPTEKKAEPAPAAEPELDPEVVRDALQNAIRNITNALGQLHRADALITPRGGKRSR